MSSGIANLMILSEEQKFNGDNLLSWSTDMKQLLCLKEPMGYINGKITLPPKLEVDTVPYLYGSTVL